MNGDKVVRELIAILQREVRSFTTLLELLIIEEKALLECDNNLLIDVLGRQEDVLSSIACLEKSRQELVDRCGELFGVDSDTVTISVLADHIPSPLDRELRETAHVLREINENLHRKKTSNTLLIRQGALIVENNLRCLMKAFGRTDAAPGVYNRGASTGPVSGSIGIDGRL